MLSKKNLRARPLCSLGQVSVIDLFARPLYRSLKEVSWQDLRTRSLQQIPWQDLLIFLWDLCASSLLTGKMPDATAATIFLCEPALWCTWLTFHKSHFVWKFTRKMLNATDTTSIEHRSSTPTVRPPQCGKTVWGKKSFFTLTPKKAHVSNVCFRCETSTQGTSSFTPLISRITSPSFNCCVEVRFRCPTTPRSLIDATRKATNSEDAASGHHYSALTRCSMNCFVYILMLYVFSMVGLWCDVISPYVSTFINGH